MSPPTADRDGARPAWWGAALWVLGGALLGAAWFAPSLISNWRVTSAPYADMTGSCDPTNAPCVARFEDGRTVTLQVATSTLPERRRAFEFRVETTGSVAPERVELSGINMMSGLFRLPLEPGDAGWRASTHLPRCTMKRMRWRAEVVSEAGTAAFAFDALNPPP